MSAVILATRSPDLAKRMGAAAGEGLVIITPEQLPASPTQVMALVNGSGPLTTLVVDPAHERVGDSLSLATRFAQQFPAVSVLLVTDHGQELGLAALRA